MSREKKSIRVAVLVLAFIGMGIYMPGTIVAGNLEPSNPPGSTMKTLDEIPPSWSQILPASERFELVLNYQAVLDKETGLVWEQSPGTDTYHWFDACYQCINKNVGGRKGWRLPTVEELSSLVDTSGGTSSLPSGHPFSNVQLTYYWSSTTSAGNTALAWLVSFALGDVFGLDKSTLNYYVWCVRGSKGNDGY